MAHADLGAETVADLDGGSNCVSGGTSTERVLASYLESNDIDVEVVVFESGDEVKTAYFNQRCDRLILFSPPLATIRATAENADAHVIVPDVLGLEPEGIIAPEGDPN